MLHVDIHRWRINVYLGDTANPNGVLVVERGVVGSSRYSLRAT